MTQNHPGEQEIGSEVTITIGDSGSDTFSSDEEDRDRNDAQSDEDEFETIDSEEDSQQAPELMYTIKLVNPTCKKDFCSVELGKGRVYKSLVSLQGLISKKLSKHPKFKLPDLKSVEMGYVEPGHGMKGRKIWIHTDDDVKMMYEKYGKKKTILLWCYTEASPVCKKGAVASNSIATGKGGTKYGQHLDKRSEVDTIYDQLQEKHTGYSPRRLRAWANMVHLKSWTSLDKPPDKPFFTHGRKRCCESEGESSTPKKSFPASVISPGKKVRVRSELIDQLDIFHKLKESGVLSSTEYNELRSTILTDIKDL